MLNKLEFDFVVTLCCKWLSSSRNPFASLWIRSISMSNRLISDLELLDSSMVSGVGGEIIIIKSRSNRNRNFAFILFNRKTIYYWFILFRNISHHKSTFAVNQFPPWPFVLAPPIGTRDWTRPRQFDSWHRPAPWRVRHFHGTIFEVRLIKKNIEM